MNVDDKIAITELMAKYAWAIDTGDVDAYVACFVPGAFLKMRDRKMRGHDEIRTYISGVVSRPDFPGRQHHHNELMFSGEGDRCSVKSYSTITQRFEDGESKIVFLGLYRDVCVRTASEWLFEERQWDVWDTGKLESYRT